jgi:iron(III) transport system substrate-binding protein
MVQEIVNGFKTWYGHSIEVTITKTSSQAAFEKAKTYYVDPEADIWWGGPLSFFNNVTAGLLQYDSAYWHAASQSGLGIMYNEHTLNTLGLSIPKTWADLLDQRYMENMAMTEPINSEFTSLFIMLILQDKTQTTNGVQNWTAGWEYLIKLAASIKEYDNDESNTILKVSSGYLPLAIVPDFYAYDKMAILVPDISFTYLDATVLRPDPIAIFSKGKNQNEAKAFIDFILTQQAQNIIGKYLLPIRSDATVTPPRINPFSTNFPFIANYNKTFEDKMKQIVEDYYSIWITQKHSQVRALWKGIIEINKTKGTNTLANHYYNLAYNNFTYLGRYLNRTYIDTIYNSTGNWTNTVKKQPYITQWNGVCTTTYTYVTQNILLAKEAIG